MTHPILAARRACLIGWLAVTTLVSPAVSVLADGPAVIKADLVLSLHTAGQADQPPVNSAAVLSADGQLLASGGDDHLVRVFNTRDGEILHTLAGHTDWVRAVTFHPQSPWLASAGDDRQILIWDVKSGELHLALAAQAQAVYGLKYSPDGQWLAAVGFAGQLALFDAVTGALSKTLDCPSPDTRAVAFSPDAVLVAAAGRDGRVRIWDVATGEVRCDLITGRQRLRAVAFSPDGALLAAGGDGRQISVWDVDTAAQLNTLEVRPGKVFSLAWCDPERLAAGTSEDIIQIWNVSAGEVELRLEGHEGSVAAVDYHAGQDLLVSGSFDTSLRLWRPGLSPTAGIREARQR